MSNPPTPCLSTWFVLAPKANLIHIFGDYSKILVNTIFFTNVPGDDMTIYIISKDQFLMRYPVFMQCNKATISKVVR